MSVIEVIFILYTIKTAIPRTTSRTLRKIASNEHDQLGDITTLADPSVVKKLVENRLNK